MDIPCERATNDRNKFLKCFFWDRRRDQEQQGGSLSRRQCVPENWKSMEEQRMNAGSGHDYEHLLYVFEPLTTLTVASMFQNYVLQLTSFLTFTLAHSRTRILHTTFQHIDRSVIQIFVQLLYLSSAMVCGRVSCRLCLKYPHKAICGAEAVSEESVHGCH